MKKIISLFLVFLILTIPCGCSRDKSMGVGEFSDRISKDYELIIEEASLSLEKEDGKNRVYCKLKSHLFVFYLGTNDNIFGIASMLTKENENELSDFVEDFIKCVSVFTLQSYDTAEETFEKCNISADKIKFTDGNSIYTVGKFKYSVITSELSVTLFCERI